MRKYFILIIAVLCFSGSALAQIPNAGFENWTSMGAYSNPDDWDQLNSVTTGMSVYTCTKGTPGNTGNAYIRLMSKAVDSVHVMPGLAVSGTINKTTMKPKSGFAFSQMPVSLKGSWQYMAMGDTGFIAVYLTKWNSGTLQRDTIAKAMQPLLGMVMAWANFNINLIYSSTTLPDSAMIVLSAGGKYPAPGSSLYVDDLSFYGNTVGIKNTEPAVSSISVYPNPTSDSFVLEFTTDKSTTVKLQLQDINGRTVKEIPATEISGAYQTAIHTTNLAPGLYFLKIATHDAVEVKKVMIY